MQKLNGLREQIDHLDIKLIDILASRFSINTKIKELKALNGVEITDTLRENEMIQARRCYATEREIDPAYIEELFRHLLSFVKASKL